eukprot:CAMPEP_0174739986 /NCGR_PEP_ID=MMETSP1094-20130205/72520_1 /TAXON_ID=156173 /ORGANISM="Chrysochromulina brevifilum, Strain UTEX LB 985" /LENGTH=34 /DNA_ID= /DNA_START= /DNA_END= /DNA_ORIENTATION=
MKLAAILHVQLVEVELSQRGGALGRLDPIQQAVA